MVNESSNKMHIMSLRRQDRNVSKLFLKWILKFKYKWFTNLLLILIYIAYLVFGVYMLIENEQELNIELREESILNKKQSLRNSILFFNIFYNDPSKNDLNNRQTNVQNIHLFKRHLNDLNYLNKFNSSETKLNNSRIYLNKNNLNNSHSYITNNNSNQKLNNYSSNSIEIFRSLNLFSQNLTKRSSTNTVSIKRSFTNKVLTKKSSTNKDLSNKHSPIEYSNVYHSRDREIRRRIDSELNDLLNEIELNCNRIKFRKLIKFDDSLLLVIKLLTTLGNEQINLILISANFYSKLFLIFYSFIGIPFTLLIILHYAYFLIFALQCFMNGLKKFKKSKIQTQLESKQNIKQQLKSKSSKSSSSDQTKKFFAQNSLNLNNLDSNLDSNLEFVFANRSSIILPNDQWNQQTNDLDNDFYFDLNELNRNSTNHLNEINLTTRNVSRYQNSSTNRSNRPPNSTIYNENQINLNMLSYDDLRTLSSYSLLKALRESKSNTRNFLNTNVKYLNNRRFKRRDNYQNYNSNLFNRLSQVENLQNQHTSHLDIQNNTYHSCHNISIDSNLLNMNSYLNTPNLHSSISYPNINDQSDNSYLITVNEPIDNTINLHQNNNNSSLDLYQNLNQNNINQFNNSNFQRYSNHNSKFNLYQPNSFYTSNDLNTQNTHVKQTTHTLLPNSIDQINLKSQRSLINLKDVNHSETKSKKTNQNIPITIPLFMICFFIMINIILIHLIEGTNLVDSFVLVSLSITTNGFGDYLPKSSYFIWIQCISIYLALILTFTFIIVTWTKLSNKLKNLD